MSNRPLSRIMMVGLAVLLGACRSAPGTMSVVQECIQIPGRVVVVPGSAPDTQLQAISRNGRPLVDPLSGKPAGLAAIVVTVTNPMGRPIENAEVVLPDTDRGKTGKNGRIEFRVLAPREHRVTVSAPDWQSQHFALVSRAGFVDSIRVYLSTASLATPCDERR